MKLHIYKVVASCWTGAHSLSCIHPNLFSLDLHIVYQRCSRFKKADPLLYNTIHRAIPGVLPRRMQQEMGRSTRIAGWGIHASVRTCQDSYSTLQWCRIPHNARSGINRWRPLSLPKQKRKKSDRKWIIYLLLNQRASCLIIAWLQLHGTLQESCRAQHWKHPL